MKCPNCSAEMTSRRNSWLLACGECGLLGSTFVPDIADSGEQADAIDEATREIALDAVRPDNNRIILQHVAALFPGGRARILDVGCGFGQFIADAAAAGHDVVGIEPDGYVARKARENGADIRSGFFPQVLSPDDRFDVIIFNDVLEHLPDLSGVFEACRAHLDRGGVMIVNAPVSSGVFYRVADILDRVGVSSPFERLWQVGLPSPHLWYFTVPLLASLGNRHGMELADSHVLMPVSRHGLWQRIVYVRNQPALLGYLTYIAVRIALPVLRFLPKDSAVVYLRKVNDSDDATP